MKFSTDLWDGFPLVVRKTECGLQSCKDMMAFYRKRAQIEEEYSKALVKLCVSATSEKRMIFKGRGTGSIIGESPSILHGWESVIASTERAAKLHAETAKKFNEDCAEPVSSFIKDMEKQREKVVQEGQRLTKEYDDLQAAVEKAKQNYFKASFEVESNEKAIAEMKADPSKAKELSKNASKTTAVQDKLKQVEKEYREKIDTANAFQDKFMKEAMPKVLDELEHWESVRNHLIKSNIKKFAYACGRVPEILRDSVAQMAKNIDVIDSQFDNERFVEENKTYNVPPGPLEFENYVSGSVAVDKKKFDLSELSSGLGSFSRKVSSLSATALSSAASLASGGGSSGNFNYLTKEERKETVFEMALEDVMALQKDQPELEVPKILKCLTDAVIAMGGLKTEGIFRVPASATEVQNLKKQVNQGNYAVVETAKDVNVPAALLKLWFRSLPDPIVPTLLYEAAASSTGTEGAFAIYNKLPPLNSKVVKHLVQFLSAFAAPEVAQKTLMSLENLSMVFAPSILRCPSEDPLVILSYAKKELSFLRNLILALAPPVGYSAPNTNPEKPANISIPPKSPNTNEPVMSPTSAEFHQWHQQLQQQQLQQQHQQQLQQQQQQEATTDLQERKDLIGEPAAISSGNNDNNPAQESVENDQNQQVPEPEITPISNDDDNMKNNSSEEQKKNEPSSQIPDPDELDATLMELEKLKE